MIYFDTSALVKLVVREPESHALARWLDERLGEDRVTSVISRVELVRAAHRVSASATTHAHQLLRFLDVLYVTDAVIERAQTIGGPYLRTLDALHLASAESIRPRLTAMCGYDRRLLDAAAAAGLPTASPRLLSSP